VPSSNRSRESSPYYPSLPDSPTSVANNTTCGTFWSAATAFMEQRSRKLRQKRSGQSSSSIDAAFLTFVRDITSSRHPTTEGETTPTTVHPLIPPFCTAALTYATDALSKNVTATDEAALGTVHALLTQPNAATTLSRGWDRELSPTPTFWPEKTERTLPCRTNGWVRPSDVWSSTA